ncbi:MAG: Enoyl-CoA hydratase [Solirubrobacterales bacterium]|nr:Enoyl-CoA hydratase [Solirubrobacterales bacterium]
MLTINGIDDLKAREGQELGVSEYKTIDQASIDKFADATDDHQFIHVDPEKAKATPFGGTIAHGLFTLSLGPVLNDEVWTITNVAFALNYGYEKVRFPAPVPVDSKLRMRATLAEVTDVAGGVQVRVTQTFEIEGGEKPVCVAESLVRVYGG